MWNFSASSLVTRIVTLSPFLTWTVSGPVTNFLPLITISKVFSEVAIWGELLASWVVVTEVGVGVLVFDLTNKNKAASKKTAITKYKILLSMRVYYRKRIFLSNTETISLTSSLNLF